MGKDKIAQEHEWREQWTKEKTMENGPGGGSWISGPRELKRPRGVKKWRH